MIKYQTFPQGFTGGADACGQGAQLGAKAADGENRQFLYLSLGNAGGITVFGGGDFF